METDRREFIKKASLLGLDCLAGAPITRYIFSPFKAHKPVENPSSVNIYLNYGTTDGDNIPYMPEGKYFCVGYNPKYGLINVRKDRGEHYYEGRVNIEDLLSETQSRGQEEIDTRVEEYIMEAYHNSEKYRKSPEKYNISTEPIMEVLTDKRDY